jgi:hypothetical protein
MVRITNKNIYRNFKEYLLNERINNSLSGISHMNYALNVVREETFGIVAYCSYSIQTSKSYFDIFKM